MAASTVTASAILAYVPGSKMGEARQGYYNGVAYGGNMVFTFTTIPDLSKIDITGISLVFHVGALGGAYTKVLYLKYGSYLGSAVGNYSFTGCYNTNKTLNLTASNNSGGFTILKNYIGGLSGSNQVILGVNSPPTSRGKSDGKAWDYDYMNITAATLTLLYESKKTSGSVTNAKTGSTADRPTLTLNTASASFKHNISWKLGTWSENQNNITGSLSYSLKPSAAIPHNALPNSTSGSGTVTVETFDGATSLGSFSLSFTGTVPDSVKPTITSWTVMPDHTGGASTVGGSTYYIQNKSKAKAYLTTVAPGDGATITNYQLTTVPNYGSISVSSWATGSSNAKSTNLLTGTGNVRFSLVITDSRGRRSTASTKDITITPYANPAIASAQAVRYASDGTVDEITGTYCKIKIDYSISSIGSPNQNGISTDSGSHSLKIKSGSTVITTSDFSDNTWTSLLGSGNLDVSTTYTVEATLKDKVGSTTTYTFYIPTANYIMHIKKGGKAVGIGEAASGTNHFGVKWATDFGSTVTALGEIRRKASGIDITQTNNGISSNTYPGFFVRDKGDRDMIRVRAHVYTDGGIGAGLYVVNWVNGSLTEKNGFYTRLNKDGTQTYAFGNGGAVRSALGLGSSTGALPIANGGTGQTTAAAARNALGLGNTSGALPVANGGTEATTALGARQNLHAELGDYTNSEVETGGKWIDNKKIYRYAWKGNKTVTNGQVTMCTLPSTPDTVINLRGIRKLSNGQQMTIPNAYYGNIGYDMSIAVDSSNNVVVSAGSQYASTSDSFVIIVEYTK